MRLLLFLQISAVLSEGAREFRDDVSRLLIGLNKGIKGWRNTNFYLGGRRGCRSNILNKGLCSTLETNEQVVEARILMSGDGDLSRDIIPGSVLRYELVSLVV